MTPGVGNLVALICIVISIIFAIVWLRSNAAISCPSRPVLFPNQDGARKQ